MTVSGSTTATRRVFADTTALYAAAAEGFASLARDAIAARGRCHVAMAGGGTPQPLYQRLARPPFRDTLDWSRIDVWFGDERCVPPDSDRSNYHMVDQALLQNVAIPTANVHRMRGELPPPDAAADYADALRGVFGGRRIPRMDLILLGVGGDGHTASLFPKTPALRERDRWVCAQFVEAQQEWRLTLTYPLLDAAAALWVLAHGADKAAIVARVLDGPSLPSDLPIQAVAPVDGELQWWLDRASASGLRG